MRTLTIAHGRAVVLLDDADYERVSRYSWSLGGGGKRYAYANIAGRIVAMHRLLASAVAGQMVDHIDGNPLNNQRANLRLCTAKENRRNSRKRASASSAYKGVCWNREKGKWQARLFGNGRQRLLGRFESEIDAARAYNAAAQQEYGEFAHLNRV